MATAAREVRRLRQARELNGALPILDGTDSGGAAKGLERGNRVRNVHRPLVNRRATFVEYMFVRQRAVSTRAPRIGSSV